jgi:hypothetical protein
MILSTHQPYFAPHPGFFYKVHRSDVFVILDTVQFPRGTTWLTRNRLKSHQGTLWLTVPVWRKGLGLQRIDEVMICHDFPFAKKHLAGLKSAYNNAPYLGEHMGFLKRLYSTGYERLLDLNLDIIRYVMEQFEIGTRLIRLSELGVEGKGEELLIDVCGALGADTFLAQNAAMKYLDRQGFEQAGVTLSFFRPPSPIYPQLWGDFIPNLSVFDLLLNCGSKARKILVDG